MRIEQKCIEIDDPQCKGVEPADEINHYLQQGWRVKFAFPIQALSCVNFQPITSSVVVVFEREVPDGCEGTRPVDR